MGEGGLGLMAKVIKDDQDVEKKKNKQKPTICTCLLFFCAKFGPLGSHATAASTRTETLCSIEWLSDLEIRNVAKVLKLKSAYSVKRNYYNCPHGVQN